MKIIYWLLCILIGSIPAIIIYIKDRKRAIPIPWLPGLLRFLVVSLTASLLLSPLFKIEKKIVEKPLILWLQDNSSSIVKALGKDSVFYFEQINQLKQQFSSDYQFIPLQFDQQTQYWKDTNTILNGNSTNIHQALKFIDEQYLQQNVGAIIIASDGAYNEGQDPNYFNFKKPVPLFTLGLGDSTKISDARIQKLYYNKTANIHNTFQIAADIQADQLTGKNVEVQLLQNGHAIKSQKVNIDQNNYFKSILFEVEASSKGFFDYEVRIVPLENEKVVYNNSQHALIEIIEDKIKVFLLSEIVHPDIGAIKEALSNAKEIELKTGNIQQIPSDISSYQLIIYYQYNFDKPLPESVNKLPKWIIAGNRTDIRVLNSMQSLVEINSVNNAKNQVLPQLNAQFNLFQIPGNTLERLEKFPPLSSPYATYKIKGAASTLLYQKLGNITTDYPLWLYGTQEAVLIGEGIWRWRIYEYKEFKNHELVDDLIKQTVSLLAKKTSEDQFNVFPNQLVSNSNQSIIFNAYIRNANGEFINEPKVDLAITDADNKILKYDFVPSGNTYSTQIGILEPGKYNYTSTTIIEGKKWQKQGTFLVNDFPLEDLKVNADFDVLIQLANKNNGHFFTINEMEHILDSVKNNKEIKPVMRTEMEYLSIINLKWLFFLILLLAITEWLLRKYWNITR